MEAFEDRMRLGGASAVKEAAAFLMGDDSVHGTLRAVARRLDEEAVDYAIAGGMALVAHGYNRTTVDVDILVTAEGLETIRRRLVGLGDRPAFEGSQRQFRDTDRGVRVEFLVSGEFPGDGKPKPVAFPDPATSAVDVGGIRYLRLEALVELKLASGISHPGRLKDLADVQELIRARDLPLDLHESLHPSVREKYVELWQATRQG